MDEAAARFHRVDLVAGAAAGASARAEQASGQIQRLQQELGLVAGSQGSRAELAAVDRQIQVHVDELAAVDRATTAVLSGVAQLLRVLNSVELEGGWVATATDPQVVELLSRYGVAETAQEQWLAEAAMFLPSGAEGDRRLRDAAGGYSPART
jgi:hypothetical protein